MDFRFCDYISVNTFWTILFIDPRAARGRAARRADASGDVGADAGARTAQAPAGFVTRFRAVQGAGYAAAVCVLWIVTFFFGAWIYTKYRMYVRIPIEQDGLLEDARRVRAEGAPCHRSGSGCCRSTGTSGRTRAIREYDSPRKWLTVTLAAHVLVHVPHRPHRQQRPGVRIMSTTTASAVGAATRIARVLGGVPDLRDRVRDRDADHLRDLRDAELAAVHLSSRNQPGRSRLGAGGARRGPGDVLVRLDRHTLIGVGRARRARHDAAGKHRPGKSRCRWSGSCRSRRSRS